MHSQKDFNSNLLTSNTNKHVKRVCLQIPDFVQINDFCVLCYGFLGVFKHNLPCYVNKLCVFIHYFCFKNLFLLKYNKKINNNKNENLEDARLFMQTTCMTYHKNK